MSGQPSSNTARAATGVAAGLVAGLVASFVMDRFQALTQPTSDSDEEPATQKAADMLARGVTGKPLPEEAKPAGGQIVHYGLGAALGITYGLAAEFAPRVTAGRGTVFAAGTWAILDEAAVPAAGLGDPPWKAPVSTQAYGFLSHLVFGLAAEMARILARTAIVRAQPAPRTPSARKEGSMPSTVQTLNLADARRLISAGEAEAARIGVPMNVAVVDAGGNLIAHVRMDGAWLGSVGIAVDKAWTARSFDMATEDLGKIAQPGKPAFGIHTIDAGRVVIFGGGVPVKAGEAVLGAVGVSGGTPDQDVEVAEAAAAAFGA